MAAALFLLGCAIVAGTAFFTAARYGDLPERIPIHFGMTGVADNYGPRPVAWLLVGVQLLVLVAYGVLHVAGTSVATLFVGDVVVAALAWTQAQIIALAISGKNRISPWKMWSMIALIILAAVVSPRFPH